MAEMVGGDDGDEDDADDGGNAGLSFLSIPPKSYISCNTTLARLYIIPSYKICIQDPPICTLKAITKLPMRRRCCLRCLRVRVDNRPAAAGKRSG